MCSKWFDEVSHKKKTNILFSIGHIKFNYVLNFKIIFNITIHNKHIWIILDPTQDPLGTSFPPPP